MKQEKKKFRGAQEGNSNASPFAEKTERITLRLPGSQVKWLKAQQGKSPSQIVSELIPHL